jgi:hypothetical protein
MIRQRVGWLALCAALAGCPQERPGAEKTIPAQGLPPALTVEPPAGADAGLGASAPTGDGGAATPGQASGAAARRP